MPPRKCWQDQTLKLLVSHHSSYLYIDTTHTHQAAHPTFPMVAGMVEGDVKSWGLLQSPISCCFRDTFSPPLTRLQAYNKSHPPPILKMVLFSSRQFSSLTWE
ncbi:exonuclease mut-7-like protein [Platysternon megacephalum]|uniref:Exonuclease mut-7-like protein n=1 Tax=Platysternon megacephalum TaxID=55544 RepID=A0A4D9E592_9SAUR|nr:exonuclease mut-7-like protein [Platysternon megacephalum]